jgi:cyclopropane-fatty-acyl-phospholipid synthase
MLLAQLLDRLVTTGTLRVTDARGRTYQFGDGAPPRAAMRLTDPALNWKLAVNPRLYLGEAYMDGTLVIEEGDIFDLLDVLCCNAEAALNDSMLSPIWNGFGTMFRRLQQWNPVSKSKANVAHHYDLSDGLYELFLDRDRQYSCAYFQHPDDDIETAQYAKKRHLAAKLLLRPGMKVLDIGCGWGGLALFLARETGADVTGLTLSEEQHKVATRRAAQAGLADRVRFHLRDYRQETGSYDRIVSVGMFEHVGVPQYRAYFGKVRELLATGGVALLHSIGRMDGPGATNPWIRKYIFPGGYVPALSEVLPVVEKTGLWVSDIEVLRLHYARTLRCWRRRFRQNWDKVRTLYDERFCRMWEFYLAGSEIAFRHMGHMVFQMQISKALETVPLTLDYITDWERAHKEGTATRERAA